MIHWASDIPIYLHRDPVDFRKAINGLFVIVSDAMELAPLTYACPCCSSHIVTASKPKQPIEKSISSPGLLAFVATSKYADALPLYRQSDMFKCIGIDMD
ncbi:IS66 family transposase [Marinomonas mediterranea]|jgi:Transposase and inactivated derivatives|uniref:IS66 family transposase n=1 Tax=Marinomonas mediterranea TaxID=119864 RepID=UPI000305957E|nr:transposase [Marinomonas mediterranea]